MRNIIYIFVISFLLSTDTLVGNISHAQNTSNKSVDKINTRVIHSKSVEHKLSLCVRRLSDKQSVKTCYGNALANSRCMFVKLGSKLIVLLPIDSKPLTFICLCKVGESNLNANMCNSNVFRVWKLVSVSK